jgi:hypothetical protein
MRDQRVFVLDYLLEQLRTHRGAVFGVERSAWWGETIVLSALSPSEGLVPVGATGGGRLAQVTWDEQGRPYLHGKEVEVLPYRHDYPARTAGLVDTSKLNDACVAILGLGSVGNPMALGFARAGVGRLVLWDGDRVALANLSRSGFDITQLDESKVLATARNVVAANPAVEVRTVARNFDPTNDGDSIHFDDVDLIVSAASNKVGFALAEMFHHRVPMLFPGLHAGAASGELFVSLGAAFPEQACFSCFRGALAKKELPHAEGAERSWNYQGAGGELIAEPGLGADIGHVVSMATAVGLQILAGNVGRVLSSGKQLLLASNRNGHLFEQAYTTSWNTVPRDPNCPNHVARAIASETDVDDTLQALQREA